MNISEPITIGLSEDAHEKLKWLKEEEHFGELLDGYRFAIGLAIAQGVVPPEIKNRTTIFNVGTVDPDQSLKQSIEVLMDDQIQETPVYRIAERLAEWGVKELAAQAKDGKIDFVLLLNQASKKKPVPT